MQILQILLSNVATATLTTPGVFNPAGCFGGSRALTGSTATISMTITPNTGFGGDKSAEKELVKSLGL